LKELKDLRRDIAHEHVKNAKSKFPPIGHHCATILQHQQRRKSDRTGWHQQDHTVEEVRIHKGTSHMRERSRLGMPIQQG
jgi:hypothetical protein